MPTLPVYVMPDQARAIINAAGHHGPTAHRLLLETFWQSGGRVSEVLRLRPCDVSRDTATLTLTNLKQRRRAMRQKVVYVSPDLTSALLAYARDAKLAPTAYFFQSQKSDSRGGAPMGRQHAWRLIQRYSTLAHVQLVGSDGTLRPATGLDFRHGAAVNQVRHGVPLGEVQKQLGHARPDTTLIYADLASRERREMADRVTW